MHHKPNIYQLLLNLNDKIIKRIKNGKIYRFVNYLISFYVILNPLSAYYEQDVCSKPRPKKLVLIYTPYFNVYI